MLSYHPSGFSVNLATQKLKAHLQPHCFDPILSITTQMLGYLVPFGRQEPIQQA